jgi:ABC-type Zn2+ transport system substrate-binding protein/surface adhesin
MLHLATAAPKDLQLATIDAQKIKEANLVIMPGKKILKRLKKKNANMQSAISIQTTVTITNIDKPQNN